jgi:hypothetical protein
VEFGWSCCYYWAARLGAVRFVGMDPKNATMRLREWKEYLKICLSRPGASLKAAVATLG